MRMAHTSEKTPEELLGAWVREAREHRGWSQETLARQLGETAGIDLHQSAVARLERGERPIRLNEAAALSKILNLDLRMFSPRAEIPTFVTFKEVQQAEETLSGLASEEARVREELRSLHERYEEEVSALRSNLLMVATESLKLRMAIADWAKRDNGKH